MIAQDTALTPKRIARLQAEFARLSRMTSYQRANERAATIKADKWLAYQPLTQAQLYDSFEAKSSATLLVQNGGVGSMGRSRRVVAADDLYLYEAHMRVILRPTELTALEHAQGYLNLDSDFVVIRQEPTKEERWCIFCQKHHETFNFIQSKRYLNGLSYACKHSLRERNMGLRRLAS